MPFLVRTCGAAAVAGAFARVFPAVARARFGPNDEGIDHRDVAKETLLGSLLAGRDVEWFAAAGRAFALALPSRVRPEMIERVEWHRTQGHELVIVSASLLTYLKPFARHQRFDHVIAVDLEADHDGRLTGRLTGPNVRGPEKAVRLRSWLAGEQPRAVWGYGNSHGDAELLELADHAVWVNRRTDLRAPPTPTCS